MSRFRPSLAVHVVWHPGSDVGAGYADALFAHLFEDPGELASHGLRIPVRQWTSPDDGPDPPPPRVPPLADARRNAVVIVLDTKFVTGSGWLDLLDDIAAAQREHDVVLCVTCTAAALQIQSPIAEHNVISLNDLDDPALARAIMLNRVTHALCRLAAGSPQRVSVFLSHAKLDGLAITDQVRDFLQKGSGVGNFFDAQDILEGTRWADVLHDNAAQSVLLAIRTDAYATREWCRTEVLDAKLAGSPVVVLDALETMEPRGFPYLGNAPSVRWHPDASRLAMEQLLAAILREALRFRHFPLRVADLCRACAITDHDHVLPAPPELLTALRARDRAGDLPAVYPDPPMGTDELALIRELAPALELTTPTRLIAAG